MKATHEWLVEHGFKHERIEENAKYFENTLRTCDLYEIHDDDKYFEIRHNIITYNKYIATETSHVYYLSAWNKTFKVNSNTTNGDFEVEEIESIMKLIFGKTF